MSACEQGQHAAVSGSGFALSLKGAEIAPAEPHPCTGLEYSRCTYVYAYVCDCRVPSVHPLEHFLSLAGFLARTVPFSYIHTHTHTHTHQGRGTTISVGGNG
jgi:hypothetical protein